MILPILKNIGKLILPKVINKIFKEKKAINKAKFTINLDRNGDGKVNLKDFPEITGFVDVNGDGRVDLNDLVELTKKNNRKKLYAVIALVVVGAVVYFFAFKTGLILFTV